MKKIEEIFFSYFNPGVHQTILAKKITIPEVVERIRSEMYKKATLLIRAGKALKTKILDSVIFAGIFDIRCEAGLREYSTLIVFDIDFLDFASTLKWRLSIDVFLKVVLAFISPGGQGLKFVVRVKGGIPEEHELYFNAVTRYMKGAFGIEIDRSGKDKSRLCFLCWDPAVFYSPEGYVEREALLRLLPPAVVEIACRDARRASSDLKPCVSGDKKQTLNPEPQTLKKVHAKGAEKGAEEAAAAGAAAVFPATAAATATSSTNATSVPVFTKPDSTNEPRPSDLLNRMPQVHERAVAALKADGWQQNSNEDLWTRPGKDLKEGCSAIYNLHDTEGIWFFTNFSTNSPHFGRRGYTDVQILCQLEFYGNWQKCISDLANQYLN